MNRAADGLHSPHQLIEDAADELRFAVAAEARHKRADQPRGRGPAEEAIALDERRLRAARAAPSAAPMPAGPPPITRTSTWSTMGMSR